MNTTKLKKCNAIPLPDAKADTIYIPAASNPDLSPIVEAYNMNFVPTVHSVIDLYHNFDVNSNVT